MPKQHKRSYRHLTQADRDRLEALFDSGTKQKEIAKILKVDPGTVSREIKRNRRRRTSEGQPLPEPGRYDADTAQHKTRVRRAYASFRGKRIEENKDLRNLIVVKLGLHWSPDTIAGWMKRHRVKPRANKDTIYDWLYKTARGSWYCHLLFSGHKRRRRIGKRPKRTMIPNRKGLIMRPRGATNRTRYGHREGDTVVSGKKTGGRAALAVSKDRKAHHILLRKIPSLKPDDFNRAVNEMDRAAATLSMTLDNGIENVKHERLPFPAFFCDPHAPWQKGSVENEVRLLRRYIKKGSDIGAYSDDYIQWVEDITNGKPRKSLDYATPDEVMARNQLFKVENKKIPVRGNCT